MRYLYLYSSLFLGFVASAQEYSFSTDDADKSRIYFGNQNTEIQHIFHEDIPEGHHNIILKDEYLKNPYQLFFPDYDKVEINNIRKKWERITNQRQNLDFEGFVKANLGKTVRIIPQNMSEKENIEEQAYEATLIARDIIKGPYGIELNVSKDRILFSSIPQETSYESYSMAGDIYDIHVSSPLSSFFTLMESEQSSAKGLYKNIYYDSFFDGKSFIIRPMINIENKSDVTFKNADLYYFWAASEYEGQSMIVSNAKSQYLVSEKSVSYEKSNYDMANGFPYEIAKDIQIDKNESLTLPFSEPVILEADMYYSFSHRNYGREKFVTNYNSMGKNKNSSKEEEQSLPYHQYLSDVHFKWTYEGKTPLPAGLLQNNHYNQENVLIDEFNFNIPNLWPNQPYEISGQSYAVRVRHQQVSWKPEKKNNEFSNAKGEGEFIIRIMNDNDHEIDFKLREFKEKTDQLLSSSEKPTTEDEKEFSWDIKVKPHSTYEIQYKLKFN